MMIANESAGREMESELALFEDKYPLDRNPTALEFFQLHMPIIS